MYVLSLQSCVSAAVKDVVRVLINQQLEEQKLTTELEAAMSSKDMDKMASLLMQAKMKGIYAKLMKAQAECSWTPYSADTRSKAENFSATRRVYGHTGLREKSIRIIL